MKWGFITHSALIAVPLVALLISGCASVRSNTHTKDRSSAASPYGATASRGGGFVPATPAKTPTQLYSEANVKQDIIPSGRHARKYKRSMRPRYITIHSTQNFSSSADAWRHSLALKNGKLRARQRRGGNRIGYLVWHFTVDQTRAVQHLPTNEQGEHADFDGPGNNYSIGIEMCENRGNDRAATIERTAKLAAYLMHQHNIPLRKIVPHYHWPRKGCSPAHKNCPHYLLDNGHPGAKWQWFLAKVNKHYQSISRRAVAPSYPSATPVAAATPRAVIAPPRATTITTAPAPRVTRPAPPRRAPTPKARYHSVKRGETLYALARKYNTSVASIKSRNGLRNNTIGVGQRLRLP